MDQAVKRIDDLSFRVAAVEGANKHFDDKIDSMKELFAEKLTGVQKSVDGWNRIGFWLLTTTGGVVLTVVVGFALSGGFKLPIGG